MIAASLVLHATPAAAQLAFAAASTVARVEHRVDAGYGVEVSSGTTYSGSVILVVRDRLQVALTGQAGSLQPGAGADMERDLAEMGLQAAYSLKPWLSLGGGLRQRSYTTPLARQRWRLLDLNATTQVPFAVRGLEGIGRITLSPHTSVSGNALAGTAIAAAGGLEYTVGRLSMHLLYWRERYNLPQGGAIGRHEQLSAVTVGMSARIPLGTP